MLREAERPFKTRSPEPSQASSLIEKNSQSASQKEVDGNAVLPELVRISRLRANHVVAPLKD